MGGQKTLAQLAAELEDPTPKDIDPEALQAQDISSSEEKSDEHVGREHYVAVSKSQLRKSERPLLGSQYSGSKVRREDLDPLEEQEDDPFRPNSDSHTIEDEESDDELYDDPDTVNIDVQDGDDEEIDSDEAFEEGEEEFFRSKGFTFRDSGKSQSAGKKTTSENLGSENDSSEQEDLEGESDKSSFDSKFDELQMRADSSDGSDIEDGDTSGDDSDGDQVNADAQRAMMSSAQTSLASKLPGAVEFEVAKGLAIKKQYATYDSFVGARVHLQKSLIAANSLPMALQSFGEHVPLSKSVEAAENASIEVLNSLTLLLHDLRKASRANEDVPKVGKRPFSATISTPSEEIQQALAEAHHAFKTQRRDTLNKWANKTQATTLSIRNKIIKKPIEDDLLTTLDGQLLGTNRDRLIQKSRVARDCAPLQQTAASSSNKKLPKHSLDKVLLSETEDKDSASLPIYDDADFYALILRELIDHKKSYSDSTEALVASPAIQEATTPSNLLRINRSRRVNVDTKASKGRKMKYTVHEKLQNFMAPINLGTWETRQAEELFAGLLGGKAPRLDEADDVEIVDDGAEDLEMQGLRLFGTR